MRVFELVLLLLSILSIILFFIKREKAKKEIKILLILGLLSFHLIYEGYRWQMIPIYAFLLIITYCIYSDFNLSKGSFFKKIFIVFGFSVLLGLGYFLSTSLPIFEIQKPTGKYKVGSQYIYLKTNRDENITTDKNDKRELMVKAWYPSIPHNEDRETYLNDGDRFGFALKYGLPKSTFNYLDAIKTNTFHASKIADGKFPVLIFSHGSYSIASGYYTLIEEIVSHGYIVLNINHTYESVGSLFPDSNIKTYNLTYDKEHISTQKMAELSWSSYQDYNNAQSEQEQFLASEKVLKKYIAAEITQRWSKDIISVINQLSTWNNELFFKNKIDTTKIGVFGHSQGGAAAGQAILDDLRVSAGINLDGVQWGNMIDTALTKPFLLISSDWKKPHPNFNKYAYRNGSTSVFYNAKLKGSGHSNFMDIPLMINFSLINEAGSISPEKASQIINETVLTFFNNHLKNSPKNILKLAKKHTPLEIKLQK